jgi:uncharacterized membrane protein
MTHVGVYVASLAVFGIVDALWLGFMGNRLYRPALDDILLPGLRFGPAIAFYLVYPIGLVMFAIAPGLKDGSVATALARGALFGALSYATYDLTNYATLRVWTLPITLIDIAYGTIAAALVSVAGFFSGRILSGWLAS